MALTIVGNVTHHKVVDTEANILAINTALTAEHGQLYLSSGPDKSIYIGNSDGSLKKISKFDPSGTSIQIIRGDGTYENISIFAESNVRRPLVKEGDTEATNATAITEIDNVFHIGATNFGGDFTDLPYNAQYKASVLGGFRVVYGTSVLGNLYRNGGGITLNLDLSFGNDTLEPSAYFAGSPFITWNALAYFLNNVSNPFVIINIVNSNSGNPLITTGGPILYGKMIQINNGYFAGAITALKCHINFQSCSFVLGWQQWFNIQQTDIHLRDCIITFTYTILFGMYYGSNVEFRGNTTINFSNDAGGQSLADIASPISGEFRCLGKSYITFNTYGQPNKKSNGQIATDTAIKWVVGSKSVVYWNTLDLQGCLVEYGTGDSFGAQYGSQIDRTYILNLFGNKPIRTPGLTSASSNLPGVLKSIVVDENGRWGVGIKPETKKYITFNIEQSGGIDIGLKDVISLPFSGVISKWSIISETVGSIQFDILMGNTIPTEVDSITSGIYPTLIANDYSSGSASWIISEGKFLRFSVLSSDIEKAVLQLEINI